MAKEFQIERLKGSSNYHTWKFAIKNYLEMNDLEGCIEMDNDNAVKETNDKKLKKAKNILSLGVDPQIYVHIQNADSAHKIWTTLQRLYEEKGLSRKIGLLRNLISIRLDKVNGMQEYVDEIVNTSNKLSGVGFSISDEWLGAILLAGLTDTYNPFIMGIESSGIEISGDAIIGKLLDNRIDENCESAFLIKKKKVNKKKKSKACYTCGAKDHLSPQCGKKPETDKFGNKKPLNAFMVCEEDDFNDTSEKAMFCTSSKNVWFIDSGASRHMTPHKNILNNHKQCDIRNIVTANNARLKVNGVGNVNLRIDGHSVEICDVLHIPELTANLLSVKRIVEKGNRVIFEGSNCNIFNQDNKLLLKCPAENGVYRVNCDDAEKCMIASTDKNNVDLWHRRMGHLNFTSLCKMRDGAVIGVDFKGSKGDVENCETCAMGKQHRSKFEHSKNESKNLLELIHSDLMGPMENRSIGGSKYILTFIDDYSRKVFCYFLNGKDEVFDKFVKFINFVENQTERRVKILRTDNGREYLSRRFMKYFEAKGIKHQLTTPYTPQQNGIAERANRTIVERARCLLHDADLPKRFWAEASSMAVYLMNRSVNTNRLDKTPEELWSGKKVDLSKLKLFGTKVMVHVPKEKRKKWDYKSEKLIFVGYDENTKGYRCIDRDTGKIMLSRDIKFLDEAIPKNDYIEPVRVIDDCNEEMSDIKEDEINDGLGDNIRRFKRC